MEVSHSAATELRGIYKVDFILKIYIPIVFLKILLENFFFYKLQNSFWFNKADRI